MLSWTEIAADVGHHFMAVKLANQRVHVQSESRHSWIALELVDIVGIESIMLSARIAEAGAADDDAAVRVMLPVERLDWPSLKAACEEAARVADALADTTAEPL
jgi:hypothetical protein